MTSPVVLCTEGGRCIDRQAPQAILRGKDHGKLESPIAFMREYCGGGDIIHAGTYFGDFLPGISDALREGAMVWAFEPNSENYRCARITIELNGLHDRVKLTHAALGSSEGTVTIRRERS